MRPLAILRNFLSSVRRRSIARPLAYIKREPDETSFSRPKGLGESISHPTVAKPETSMLTLLTNKTKDNLLIV
jgi:hypothetical protein